MKNKEIIHQNTRNIEKKFKDFDENDLNTYVKENLPNYLSNALRLSNYYGNLWIKYIGFNFTIIAFFISVLAIYMKINSSLWLIIPFGGLLIYLIPFLIQVFFKHDTISFEHSNLQHYSCMMDRKHYKYISEEKLNSFLMLIKQKKETDSLRSDLEALVMQYAHQANYNRMGIKMRNYLVIGIIIFFIAFIISMIGSIKS